MYIFIFFILVALSQFVTNKILEISDDNSVGYSYSKRDSLILAGFFLISILLQLIKFKNKIFWISCGIYSLSILMTMIVLATIKKVIITKQREELQKIFDVLSPVLPKNLELDMNNPPFKLEYEKNQVNKIIIDINPNTFKETVAVNLCLSLNKFLPNYEWVNEFDFAARECAFVGTPLPPKVAKYKGSWLRPTEFIPIGLSGLGEVSWNINSFKNEGRSNYIYEDGKIAKTVDTPSAPQALCVGSPLSLDTIIPTTKGIKTMGTIELGDMVYALNGKEAEVIEVHKIHMSNTLYKLTFKSNKNKIEIKSDEIHQWPIKTNNGFKLVKAKDLIIGDIIIGQYEDFKLSSKIEIENELVRCIKVNDFNHLFLVGSYKNGPFVYSKNTGGGKSIYVEQEIELKET